MAGVSSSIARNMVASPIASWVSNSRGLPSRILHIVVSQTLHVCHIYFYIGVVWGVNVGIYGIPRTWSVWVWTLMEHISTHQGMVIY